MAAKCDKLTYFLHWWMQRDLRPLLGPISFICMQFSGKLLSNNRFSALLLDPPLYAYTLYVCVERHQVVRYSDVTITCNSSLRRDTIVIANCVVGVLKVVHS